MSGADIETVLVLDDRISQITSQLKYAVVKGAQQMTPQPFTAISADSNNITYNLQVPSQSTLLEKEILQEMGATIRVTVLNNTANSIITNTNAKRRQLFGLNSNVSGAIADDTPVTPVQVNPMNVCLAPFPQAQLYSTVQVTINNTTVSMMMRDILPFILRFNDKRSILKYNSTAPVMWDVYGSYRDSIGSNNSPFAGFESSTDYDILQRGAWGDVSVAPLNAAFTPLADNATDTWLTNTTRAFDVTFNDVEPLLLSPFLFSHPEYNNGCMYGLQNINLVFNMGNANRVVRVNQSTDLNFVSSNIQAVQQRPRLLINFLTTQPSQLLDARNCHGYYELPRYLTSVSQSIFPGVPTLVTTNTLQLTGVFDKLIIAVRKKMINQTCTDADCFLPIESVNLQFNNVAGILSSASKYQLYKKSVNNGYNGTWAEWSGTAAANSSSATGGKVITSGSILILQAGIDIPLSQDYLASGSIGNFSLQCQLTVTNNRAVPYNADECEIVLITMNSGIFINERGSSQIFTMPLTKEMVLSTSEQTPYSEADVRRLVGGSFWDSLKSIAGKVKDAVGPVAGIAKGVLGSMGDPRAQAASAGLGALGFGQSGAGRNNYDARL